MHPIRRRTAALMLLAVLVVAASPALAAGPSTHPLAGERHLTNSDEALALAGMPLRERRQLAPLFADARNLIVAYARRIVDFVPGRDGVLKPRWRGIHSREGEPLDIPSLEEAAFSETVTPRTSLYQSLTVYRTCSTCARWNIRHYFDWRGVSGMSNNGNRDRIAMSWADDLALESGSYRMTGAYTHGAKITPTDQWVDADSGVGWSFREWYNSQLGHYADWGRGYATIVEPTLTGDTTNIVAAYAHTDRFATGGSISFGPASISFNGSEDFTWQFSVLITT